MKTLIKICYIAITTFLLINTAKVRAAEMAYIVDQLPMVFRTGPSSGYRMQSGLITGDKIEILAVDEENQTTQIKTSAGKIGWVESKYIVATEGAKSKLIKLEKQLQALKQDVANTVQNEAKVEQQQTAISARNLQLQRQNTELRKSLEIEQQKSLRLSDKKRNEPLIFGGGIAFVGLLLGWILARSKPKRGNWN
jgi:SH3 domain protein